MEKNIVGTRIGILDVLYECDYKSNDGHKLYHIKCSECGWESKVRARRIYLMPKTCKHTNSAGQYITDNVKIAWQNERISHIYKGLIQRCYNSNDADYRWYGAKGIKICKEWLNNPISFESWALENGYADNLSIDRIDSNKNYGPDNCHWISALDNAKYKSTTSDLTVNNITHTGRDWAVALNVGTNVINTMLRKYPKEQVIEFIKRRLENPTVQRKSNQTWMNVYDLPS